MEDWFIRCMEQKFTQMHTYSECNASAVIFHHSTLKERYKYRFGTLHHPIYGFSWFIAFNEDTFILQ